MKRYLEQLETEAIFILLEAVGQFQHPCLLFSGGKDSICLLHLACKIFGKGQLPFPLLHVDTGHNFPEVMHFRDKLIKDTGANLQVVEVIDTIKNRKLEDGKGKFPSRNMLQTLTLLDAINKFGFDACIGGARRDEEKARAKERIFSVRNQNGEWNPHQQRPELWSNFNGKISNGENVRIFPLSNWTELDIWNYILKEDITLPSIYFAHDRDMVVNEHGQWMAHSSFLNLDAGDTIFKKKVRYRTVGDMTLHCCNRKFSRQCKRSHQRITRDKHQ